jgi:tetratricopeptide (TPR) repeat protein
MDLRVHNAIQTIPGRHKENVVALNKAMRLNPFPTHHVYSMLCLAYRGLGRYEEALAACEKAVQLAPDSALRHVTIARVYSLAGREEKARATVQEALRLEPRISLEFLAKMAPWKNQADLERGLSALRKAGLK